MQIKFSTPKLIVAVVLTFLTVDLWYALIYLPAKAEVEWQAERDKLIAQGEKLAITDFVPKKVPDERNFFADPLWTELSDREAATRKDGGSYHKSKMPAEEWKISVLRAPIDEAERRLLKSEFPEFSPLDADKNRLNVLRKQWDKAKKSNNAARGAEFLLKALAPSEPVIARLRELGERPDAYFPLEYQDGMGMSLEYVTPMLNSAQWLDLHASALLTLGRSPEAFRDVRLIFRLAEALSPEPTLIAALVEMSAIKMGTGLVARGIKKHVWTEAELLEFDRQLARIDIPARLAVSMRLERAVMLDWAMPLIEKDASRVLAQITSDGEDPGYRDALARPMFWLYRTYWMPGDKIFYSQTIQLWAEALDRGGEQGMNSKVFPSLVKEYLEANPSVWAKARRIMSVMALPALTGSFAKGASIQAEVFQARLAIALERYRMKYGEYPDKLDAVVPEFLPAMPLDPVTMEPFRYRREAGDKFLLWSVGWNETDENGTPARKPTEADWVWGM